jgi:hypothetical protein
MTHLDSGMVREPDGFGGDFMNDAVPILRSDFSRRRMLTYAAMSAAAGSVLVASGTLAHDEGTPSPMAGDMTSYLFVQSGFSSGILDQATEGVQSWMLTLQGAPAQTIFFSDQPARIAGAISTQSFLELLDFSGDDPPNAALVIHNADGSDVIILELTAPVYDPDAETLTYITKILDADTLEHSGLGFATDPLGSDTYPPEFGAASLFIDSLVGCNPLDPRGC